MRAHRLAVIALVAASTIGLAGCSDDAATPAADAPSPSPSSTTTPEESESTTPTASDAGDFPDVDGYTYANLPDAAFAGLDAAVQGTPQIEGVEAKLVKKGNQEVGLVMQIALDPASADVPGFEDGFLPGFAGGIAGTNAKPKYQEINGTRVITIGTSDGSGTAFAWINDATATVLVFQDASDAKAFAQAALS